MKACLYDKHVLFCVEASSGDENDIVFGRGYTVRKEEEYVCCDHGNALHTAIGVVCEGGSGEMRRRGEVFYHVLLEEKW